MKNWALFEIIRPKKEGVRGMMKKIYALMVVSYLLWGQGLWAEGLIAKYVKEDLSKLNLEALFWKEVTPETIQLIAQPMVAPRPQKTLTEKLWVQVVHNGEWMAFRFKWKDKEKSEAGPLGKFSDAVAIQFPVKEKEVPPIFMGAKDSPVHILHWRAQYQKDKEKGFQTMKDIYPNMNMDMYPLEFANQYSHDEMLKKITEEQREVFVSGKSAGNPQSFQKIKGVDEMMAEGFGSSSVIENTRAEAQGIWQKKGKEGEWVVQISRPLALEGGSILKAGQKSFMAFAVWQGGEGELGCRKSVTMTWVPLIIEDK